MSIITEEMVEAAAIPLAYGPTVPPDDAARWWADLPGFEQERYRTHARSALRGVEPIFLETVAQLIESVDDLDDGAVDLCLAVIRGKR